MGFPKPNLRGLLESIDPRLAPLAQFLEQDLVRWANNLDTTGDVTVLTPGKGIILTNSAGTLTSRVRINDTGDGIIIESV